MVKLKKDESIKNIQSASEYINEYFKSANGDLRKLQVYKNMGCEVYFFRWEEGAKADRTKIINYLNENYTARLPSETQITTSEQKINVNCKNKDYLFIFNKHENKVFLLINKQQNREFIVRLEGNKHKLYIQSQPSKFNVDRLVQSLHESRIPLNKVLEITVLVIEKIKRTFPLDGIIYSSQIVDIVRETIGNLNDIDPIWIDMFEKRYQKTEYVLVDNGINPYDLNDKKIRSLIISTIKGHFDSSFPNSHPLINNRDTCKRVIEIRDIIRSMGINVISEVTLKSIILDLATRPPKPWITVNKLNQTAIMEKIETISRQLIDVNIHYKDGRLDLVEKNMPDILDNISILILDKYNLKYLNIPKKPFETLKNSIRSLLNENKETNFIRFKDDLENINYNLVNIRDICNHLQKYAYRPKGISPKSFSKVINELNTLFIISTRIYEDKQLTSLYNDFQKSSNIEEKEHILKLLLEKVVEVSENKFVKKSDQDVISLETLIDTKMFHCFGPKVDIFIITYVKNNIIFYNDILDLYYPFIQKIKKSEINCGIAISVILPGFDEKDYEKFVLKAMDEDGYIIFLDSKDLDNLMRKPIALKYIINNKFEKILELLAQKEKSKEKLLKETNRNLNSGIISDNSLGVIDSSLVAPKDVNLNDTEKTLIKKVFQECSVDILCKITSGFSKTCVFKVQPYDKNGIAKINKIVKIGPTEIIKKEKYNYDHHVLDYLDRGHHAQIDGYEEQSGLSIICYHFVGEDNLNLLSFKDYFNKYSTDEKCQLLNKLFQDILSKFYINKNKKNINVFNTYAEPILSDVKISNYINNIAEYDGRIYLEEIDEHYTNPLKYLGALSKKLTIPVYESIIHGDLNANNIQIENDRKNIWLIDFYKTESKHIIKDFTKLETVIKFELMNTDFGSFIKFENLLLNNIELTEELYKSSGLNVKLEDPFKCIKCIRDNANNQMYHPVHFEEYLMSLLYHSLSPLSWDDFDTERKKRALYSSVLIVKRLMDFPQFQVGN